jgi:hypothetical protein
MKLLSELAEDVETGFITEETTGKKKLYIEGTILAGDVVNKNGRKYPNEILENEVRRYCTEKVATGRAYGELGHPPTPTVNPDRISHRFVELRREGNNYRGKAIVAEGTALGATLKGLLDTGGSLGISSRGLGSLKLVDGINEVQSDFRLSTAGDIVIDPSGPGCYVNGLLEGVDWIFDASKNNWVAQELVENQTKDFKKQRYLDECEKMKAFHDFLQAIRV